MPSATQVPVDGHGSIAVEDKGSQQYALDALDSPDAEDTYNGTRAVARHDQIDMQRMGKTQELKRSFRPLSALAVTVILQGTWEVLFVATTEGLSSGGVAGLFWTYIWTFCGMLFVVASLAEMASMAPTSGGQYHWVSEFAPPQYQRYLSYQTGWMATLSWQAGTASGPYLVGTLIQALLVVGDDNYEPTNWQATLFVIAVTVLVWVLNVYGANAMPMFQNLMLIVHVFGFLTIVIVLWVLSPHNSAEVVFTEFTNMGGWNSMGLTLMVGQVSALYACICSDAAAHISEEIEDAGVTVPRVMLGSYLLNCGLGLVFLITYLFCITSVEDALGDPTGYPFIYVFRNSVSLAAVKGLTFIVVALIFAGTLGFNLATSRQTWSFARDRGLPFSSWIAYVDPKMKLPVNSVTVTCGITVALSLINLGSDVAFNAIISLNLVSLMITYCISIGCVLYRRMYHPELLPPCRWSLGKWGVPINAISVIYSTYAFFWSFWPNETPVGLDTFNWASVMFVGVFIISSIYYYFYARKEFKGPVVLVEGYRDE